MTKTKVKASTSQIELAILQDGVFEVAPNQFRLILAVSSLNLELMTDSEQDYLLDSYQSFLNSLDSSLQIVLRSRQLDLDNLLETLPAPQTNYRLLKAYRAFLAKLVDEHNIQTKHFYIVIPYQTEVTNRARIRDQLYLKADLISQGLANLGLQTKILSCHQALDVFYQFYCPTVARTTPLTAKMLKSYQSRRLGNSCRLISYDRLSEQPTHIDIDGLYYRNLFVASYPYSAHSGFMRSLINFSGDIDISYQIDQIPAQLALPKLARKITELESSRRQRLKTGQVIGPEITDPLSSATELRDQIQRGQQKLFQLGIYICLRAASLDQLEAQTKLLQTSLASELLTTKVAKYQQLTALQAVLPRNQDNLYQRRNLNSAPLALTFPFASCQLVMPGGILYGVNQSSNSLVVLDRFQLNNANSICFAQSGAGKSYTTKLEILRQIMLGTQVIVIDPEREYAQLAPLVNGQLIKLASNRQAINPLTVNPAADKTESIQNLIDIISVMVGGLNQSSKATLDKLLVRLLAPACSPSLKDVYLGLKQLDPQLAAKLEPFVFGSLKSIFNQTQPIKLDKPLTVFDIKDMPSSLHKLIMLIVANFVWSQVKTNPIKRLLVIDEAWLLLEQPASASFLANITRRARKYHLGVSLISQQANDFLASAAGQVLASQSSLRILMRQDSTTIKAVTDNFNLSQQESHFLLTAEAGQALILADNQHLTAKIVASDQEHPLITTKPTEVLP